jgi:hypothetical protein
MFNQRSATVNVLLAVLKESGIEYQLNGDTPIKDVLTPQHKEKARAIICQMFVNKQVSYRPDFQAKVDDPAELRKYVGGLINNWIRKAKEFNGGETYKPKNPGARAGTSDPQVRELKKLLAKVKGTAHEAKVQTAIEARLEEIRPKVKINVALLPDDLKDLI